MLTAGNMQSLCAAQKSSRYAGSPMSVGLYSCSRSSWSSCQKRLLAIWVSMSVLPATCVQLPMTAQL